MDLILYIIACSLFLVSTGAYIYVNIRLRPRDGSDLDDYYWEFEDEHPEYARYLKWSKITLSAACLAVLLFFLTIVI